MQRRFCLDLDGCFPPFRERLHHPPASQGHICQVELAARETVIALVDYDNIPELERNRGPLHAAKESSLCFSL